MKILINSLQVSTEGSKGHLHPALQIALELKRRHHQVAFLPLPSPFNHADRKKLFDLQFEVIEPPSLPQGLLLPTATLATLANHVSTVAKAYHSFLISPLEYQFKKVSKKIKAFNPDIIVYDLLVYSAPLAARLLGIPDIGFCAGLKLIAPTNLTQIYQMIYQTLKPSIQQFLTNYHLAADFHHLELLSNHVQFVFTPEEFIRGMNINLPPRTILAGALSSSDPHQLETLPADYPTKNYIVLCFGSALDPIDYPNLLQPIIKVARQFKQYLIIRTEKPDLIQAEDIIAARYLPLTTLLKTASLFIHHGGANSFAESFSIGVAQIIIPLTTDQPIQAEFIKHAKAGIAIYPHELTDKKLYEAFQQLLNKNAAIHKRIHQAKEIFNTSHGENVVANMIENNEFICSLS